LEYNLEDVDEKVQNSLKFEKKEKKKDNEEKEKIEKKVEKKVEKKDKKDNEEKEEEEKNEKNIKELKNPFLKSSNFCKLISDSNYFFVDKTKYIEKIEKLNEKAILSCYPRRFGKSLFCDILQKYYDIKEKDNFDKNLKTYIYIINQIMKEIHILF
jgi:ATP-dependent 26S proteasome regulatory subunit